MLVVAHASLRYDELSYKVLRCCLSRAAWYAAFATIATFINIAVQAWVQIILPLNRHIWWFLDLGMWSSMIAGTLAGLAVKYYLDKRYIFAFTARNLVHDGQTFILYTAMGGVTTLIFWGFELGFKSMFFDPGMRYIGAMLGLAIGYWAKYKLDKRFVFEERP